MQDLLKFVFFLMSISVALGVDRTVEEGATGAGVVLATISKIEVSGIFSSDKRLLRRIAYVETRDGTNPARGSNHGGIWDVSMEKFSDTQQNSQLRLLRLQINAAFRSDLARSGVDGWESLEWQDLNVPLWSGLAARLTLALLQMRTRVPISSDVSGQANFWATYYNTNGNIEKFITDVEQLEVDEGCNIKSDIIFVLDSSGSIGDRNYREVISFTYKFVDRLDIGPTENQVGVVVYSSSARAAFNLNTYSEKEDVLRAIEEITYIAGGTNTADGLCLMLEGFSEENGARLTEGNVFRLAVVMTDGHSSAESSRCGYGSTLEVAKMVHNFSHPIISFAIGVTSNVNEEELEAIASKKEYVTYLANFNDAVFRETSDEQTYELCEKTTIPVELGVQRGTLEMGGRVRYELKVPQEGVTVKLCVNGSIVFYASHEVPNPNDALYDYTQTVTGKGTTSCNDAYVRPAPPPASANNAGGSPVNATATLYMSLEGVEARNEFVMETRKGDQTGTTDEEWPIIVIATLISVGMVLLVAFIVGLLVVFYFWRRKQMQANEHK